MGHKVHLCRRTVHASDVDDVHCIHVPSVRLAACVSPGRLRGRLRVRFLMFARPCACGLICDAFGAEAGFLPGRSCAALLCSILCWYWDSIPRACQALYFRVICPTVVRDEPLWGGRKMQKIVFPAAIREKSRCWVALSYDAHSVSACLGRIRQPCFPSLSDWILVRTYLKHSPFCAGN